MTVDMNCRHKRPEKPAVTHTAGTQLCGPGEPVPAPSLRAFLPSRFPKSPQTCILWKVIIVLEAIGQIVTSLSHLLLRCTVSHGL